jgi:CRP-like cAMP-binding protein
LKLSAHAPALRQLIRETSLLFSALTDAELEFLLDLGRTMDVPARQPLFYRGDDPDRFFLLIQGHAKVTTTAQDGRELVLRMLGPGDFFGEIAVLDGSERTADVTTTESSEVLVIERKRFLTYLREHPAVAVKLLGILAAKLRETTEQLSDNVFLDVSARLAKILLALANSYGEESDGGQRIELKLSQQDLADMAGTSRVSVNKLMRSWEDQRIVHTEKRFITIDDLSALEALTGVYL